MPVEVLKPYNPALYEYEHKDAEEIYKHYHKHTDANPRIFWLDDCCELEDIAGEDLSDERLRYITITDCSKLSNLQKSWFVDREQTFYTPRGTIFWLHWKPLLCAFCNVEYVMDRCLFWQWMNHTSFRGLAPYNWICHICRILLQDESTKQLGQRGFYFADWPNIMYNALSVKGLIDKDSGYVRKDFFDAHIGYSPMVNRDCTKYIDDRWCDVPSTQCLSTLYATFVEYDWKTKKEIRKFKVKDQPYPPLKYLIDPAETMKSWQRTPEKDEAIRREYRDKYSIKPIDPDEKAPPVPENFEEILLKTVKGTKEEDILREFLDKDKPKEPPIEIKPKDPSVVTTCEICGIILDSNNKTTCSAACRKAKSRQKAKTNGTVTNEDFNEEEGQTERENGE